MAESTRSPSTLLKFLEETYGLATVLPGATSISYGSLMYFLVQDKKFSPTSTTRRLSQHLGYDVDGGLLYAILKKLDKKLVLVKKRLSSDSEWKSFTLMLQGVHDIPPLRPVVETPQRNPVPVPSPSDPPVARMTRQDCQRCIERQRQLEFAIEEGVKLRAEVLALKAVVREQEKTARAKAIEAKRESQALGRKKVIKTMLRTKNTGLKSQVKLRKTIKKDTMQPLRESGRSKGEVGQECLAKVRIQYRNNPLVEVEITTDMGTLTGLAFKQWLRLRDDLKKCCEMSEADTGIFLQFPGTKVVRLSERENLIQNLDNLRMSDYIQIAHKDTVNEKPESPARDYFGNGIIITGDTGNNQEQPLEFYGIVRH